MRSFFVFIFVALMLVLMQACASSTKDDEARFVPDNPLEFDPTEAYDMPRWWTNGENLIELRPNGSYAVYATTNRYDPPIEFGRWERDFYAAVWLEPYTVRGGKPERVEIGKISENVYALKAQRLKPFVSITEPPHVLEDRLMGTWRSEDGELVLRSSLRYQFTLSDRLAQRSAGVTSHQGVWGIDAVDLELIPDSPTMQPERYEIEIDSSGVHLTSLRTGVRWEKVDDRDA